MLDFYVDNQGWKWTPRYFSKEFVYARGEYYNNISHKVFRIVDGHPDINNPHKSFLQGNSAEFFVIEQAKESQIDRPVNFVSQRVKDELAKHGKQI